jgi:hypothetical protein
MFDSITGLASKLAGTGYFIDPVMTQVVFLAAKLQKPLLLEGPAGSGNSGTCCRSKSVKTSSARRSSTACSPNTTCSAWSNSPDCYSPNFRSPASIRKPYSLDQSQHCQSQRNHLWRLRRSAAGVRRKRETPNLRNSDTHAQDRRCTKACQCLKTTFGIGECRSSEGT